METRPYRVCAVGVKAQNDIYHNYTKTSAQNQQEDRAVGKYMLYLKYK